jgi:hypothetical protein
VTAIKVIDTTNEAQIASCSLDGTIIIWKLQKLSLLQKLHYVSIPGEIQFDGNTNQNGILDMVYITVSNQLACID